jgi:hypothetical protein
VRPAFHYNAQRVRAHVFLCLITCHIEWHMRARLKPMLGQVALAIAPMALSDGMVDRLTALLIRTGTLVAYPAVLLSLFALAMA